VKQRSMTFRRVGNVSIKGYSFTQTADGILPGIPLKREKLQLLEKLQIQDKNCEKFSSIQLKFIGEKRGLPFAIHPRCPYEHLTDSALALT